jgi:hypothetical protein
MQRYSPSLQRHPILLFHIAQHAYYRLFVGTVLNVVAMLFSSAPKTTGAYRPRAIWVQMTVILVSVLAEKVA